MDSLMLTLRVLVSLAVVFGLLWFLARRMRAGRGAHRSAPVHVLGKAGIGGKAQVVVVEAEGRRMVLGVTEHGVSVLHEADAPPVEETAAQASVTPIPFPSFETLRARTQWSAPGKRSRHVIER
jgi:flagellar protein FliO/FliZ